MQTIIECLKQATTGELPPNTRSGQSFIHDPKVGVRFCSFLSIDILMLPTGMPHHCKKCQEEECLQVAGELEVKAQIKLRIDTATGQPVVIIRSFQVCFFPAI